MLDRKDDAFTLQFRDYTDLPHVVRHKSGIALMHRRPKNRACQTAAAGLMLGRLRGLEPLSSHH